MARVTAAEYAQAWANGLKRSTDSMRRGVSRVDQAPGVKAAAASDRMLQGISDAVTSGYWGRRVSAVTLPEWQRAMVDKGIPRVATGADAAIPSQTAMAETLLRAVDESAAIARALPKGTIEDSVNRAATYMREMAKRAPKRSGR